MQRSHTIVLQRNFFAPFRSFENVYIGWGQKNLEVAFEPAIHPPVMEEFEAGPETTELDDPTPEEETAWKAAQAELIAEIDESEGESDDDDENEDDDQDY